MSCVYVVILPLAGQSTVDEVYVCVAGQSTVCVCGNELSGPQYLKLLRATNTQYGLSAVWP